MYSSTLSTNVHGYDDCKLLPQHIEDYSRTAHACIEKISRLWNEIELPREERQRELDDVLDAVRHTWNLAVERAERKKEELQRQIEQAVEEIYRIKEDLGEAPKDSHRQGIEGLLKLEKIVGCSLHARFEAIQELLQQWKSQRGKREEEFKSLQSQINRLRVRFGEIVISAPLIPEKSDISPGNLQKLARDLEECKAEKMKRERELAALLSKLRSICLQLGENDIDVAAMAHPSLRFYREALPDQFSLVRPSFSNQPGLQRNIRPEDIELDLSNETFTSLETKINDIYDLKANREKQTAEVAEILKSLWKLLNIPEDDLERGIHIRALEGPTRLHLQSIEKCKNEVRRLEKAKAKELWELIDTKRSELEQLCEQTRLPMPQLCPLLSINDDNEDEGSPVGQISDALSKLSKMIAETRSLAEKREPILYQINEIEKSRAEIAWLSEYEQDSDRYKGRDSTKKLNRALRAGRMRDKLPDMIKGLRKAISQWEQEERCPFVYDSQDYSVVLENLQLALLAARDQTKARTKPKGRGRSSSRAAFTPPPPEDVSPIPSKLDHLHDPRYGHSQVSHIPGSGPRSSSQNKQGNTPSGMRSAPYEPARHYPDSVDRPLSRNLGRQRNRNAPDHSSISTTNTDARQLHPHRITPDEFELMTSSAPTSRGTADVVSYNVLYTMSPNSELGVSQSPLPQPSYKDHSDDSSLQHPVMSAFSPECSRCRTDSRLYRHALQRERHDRASGSNSSRGGSRGGNHSGASSHRSLAQEKTEGKPS